MIRRKARASRRPINNIVQVDLPMYLSSGSCHSAQQLVGSSLSYYLHNYVYLYAKWAASFRSATSCTTYTTPYIIHTNTSKSEKWILVASSTVYVRLARLGSSRSMLGGEGNMDGTPVNFTFTASLHGCVIDTKPKLKNVFIHQKMPSHHTPCLCFCCMNNNCNFMCMNKLETEN